MTNRIFRYKVSFLNLAGVAVVAVAALCAFLSCTVVGSAVGLALLLAVVSMAERMAHTAYTLTADGLLVVSRGRFSRRVTVRLTDIVAVESVRGGVMPVSYVLIRYGAGHELSAQPVDAEAFVVEIRKRQTAV